MISIKMVNPQTGLVDTYEMSDQEVFEAKILLSQLKTLKDPITVHSVLESRENEDFCKQYFEHLEKEKYASHMCICVSFEFYFDLVLKPTLGYAYFIIGGDSITKVVVPKEFGVNSFFETIETRLQMDRGGNQEYGFVVHEDEATTIISFITNDWQYQFMVFREFLYESQMYPHMIVDHKETVSKSSLN